LGATASKRLRITVLDACRLSSFHCDLKVVLVFVLLFLRNHIIL